MPIKAEMQAVRALNYFYLVKAFRNVPFVTKSVSTDAEAKASRIAATPGVVILDSLCNQLEVAKVYARDKFSNSSETKGRFTKRAIYTPRSRLNAFLLIYSFLPVFMSIELLHTWFT